MTDVKKKRQLAETVKKLDKKLGLATEKDANYYLLNKHSKLVIAKSDEVIDLLTKTGKKQGVTNAELKHIYKWLDNFKIKLPKKYPVEVLNQVKIPKTVEISNLKDELYVKNPQAIVDPIVEAVEKQNLKQALEAHTDPENPLAVRLTDGRRFIETLTKEIYAQQPAPAGLNDEEVQLLKDIITAVNNISINIGNLTVNLDDLENLSGKSAIHQYGSVTAIPATEITIATYTVPDTTPDTNFLLKFVYGEGGTDGLFVMYKNSTAIWQARNAWTQRNVKSQLEVKGVEGDVFDLKVTNQKGTNHTFTGGFFAYEY